MEGTCKFCKSDLEKTETVCSVCGIDNTKSKKELNKREKKTKRYCTCVGWLGVICVVGGIATIVTSFGETNGLMFYGIIRGAVAIVFGYGLTEFKRWAFFVGLTIIVVNVLFSVVPPFDPILLLVSFLYLWFLTNPTARAIFLRKKSSAKEVTQIQTPKDEQSQ
ncbi:MAG: hypothetical protein KAR47_02840 [Planctomycetes bacterium]|nr:hypothetical protein [Planctomycetota bacterium]